MYSTVTKSDLSVFLNNEAVQSNNATAQSHVLVFSALPAQDIA